jgi:hypothetical protein
MKSRTVLGALCFFALLEAGTAVNAQNAQTEQSANKLHTKCDLAGTWRGKITLPDGADGVSVALLLRFSKSRNGITLKGFVDNKPLVLQDVHASCADFSFGAREGVDTATFAGSLSADARTISGTVKRREVSESWSIQKK